MKPIITLTFDDGLKCQLEHAVPLMQAAGIRGTFFLPTRSAQYPIDWPEWKRVYEMGHELGGHSASHSKAASLFNSDFIGECDICAMDITSNTGAVPTSYCYPYTDAPPAYQRIVSRYYLQARGGRQARPQDLGMHFGDLEQFRFNVPAFHVNEKTFDDNSLWNEIRKAIDNGAWLTLMFHGVGPDESQWDNVSSERFSSLVNSLRLGVEASVYDVLPFAQAAARWK